MNDKEKISLAIKACNMYYIDGKSEIRIANALGISRSKISRLISYAKEKGIVNISINNPLDEKSKYESMLAKRFFLEDAIVVDDNVVNINDFYQTMADKTLALLKRYIKDGDTIGFSTGKTLYYLSEHIQPINKKNLTLVPVVGSIGPRSSRLQASSIISNFAEKWNCESYLISAPSRVSSKQVRDLLLEEKEIKKVITMAKKANVVLVGMGELNKNATLYETNFLNEDDLNELKKKKAVVSCCGSILNIKGELLNFSGDDETIQIQLNQFENATVIAFAYGLEKVEAIIGALNSRKINVLVTDLKTAKALLDF